MQHKAKKSLGQNFLKSESALREIIKAGEIKPTDVILEIGPGKGALTERLLKEAGKVIAVEMDRDLIQILEEKFKTEIAEKKLELVSGDILEVDVNKEFLKFFSGPRVNSPDHSKNLETLSYKVIANIPYNITGAILKKFLSGEHQPQLMVLLVQKEVAERIVAKDGKESLLSISVKVYGEPKYITKVAARYFSPAPKVDSAVIKIKNISKETFTKSGIKEEDFWDLVRAGFAHKRKKLLGNLKNTNKQADWVKIFKKSGVQIDVRAENVSVGEWIELCSNKNICN